MYENREAEQISIERAPFWLKSKFQTVTYWTNRTLPKLGEEHKFSANLVVDMDTRFYTPIQKVFDNNLMNKRIKYGYLYEDEEFFRKSLDIKTQVKIDKYYKSKGQSFFSIDIIMNKLRTRSTEIPSNSPQDQQEICNIVRSDLLRILWK